MAVLKSERAGLFKMRVNVGQYFEEAEDYFWIELREPSTDEFMMFQNDDETSQMSKMLKKMSNMIIDHNFEKEEGKRFGNDKVWSMIMERPVAATEIVEQWSNNIPLAQKSKTKSKDSVDTSTTDTEE